MGNGESSEGTFPIIYSEESPVGPGRFRRISGEIFPGLSGDFPDAVPVALPEIFFSRLIIKERKKKYKYKMLGISCHNVIFFLLSAGKPAFSSPKRTPLSLGKEKNSRLKKRSFIRKKPENRTNISAKVCKQVDFFSKIGYNIGRGI